MIDEMSVALARLDFKRTHNNQNNQWMIERQDYSTSAQVRADLTLIRR